MHSRQGRRDSERTRAETSAARSAGRSTRSEPTIQALSDDQLRAKTVEFRQRLADGEALDDLLLEVFAVVRETGRRVLNMRHFDVQIDRRRRAAQLRPPKAERRARSPR